MEHAYEYDVYKVEGKNCGIGYVIEWEGNKHTSNQLELPENITDSEVKIILSILNKE